MLSLMNENKKIRWKDHVNKMTFACTCTRHDSTAFSPFELFFGRKPRLPIDIIFGNSKVTTVIGYSEYMKQWKNATTDSYRIAAEKTEQCAAHGREECNKKARSSELKPGDRVLVKNLVEREGPVKLCSFWEEKIYIVLNRKGPDAAVYKIGPEDQGGRERVLHRNLLMPCPFLPCAESQKPTGKQPMMKKKNHADEIKHIPKQRLGLSVTKAKVPEDDEEQFPTITPNQLEQARQYFEEQSNMEESTIKSNGDASRIHDTDQQGDTESEPAIFAEDNHIGQEEVDIPRQSPDQSFTESKPPVREIPRRTRYPPTKLSYYGLETLIDNHAGIFVLQSVQNPLFVGQCPPFVSPPGPNLIRPMAYFTARGPIVYYC